MANYLQSNLLYLKASIVLFRFGYEAKHDIQSHSCHLDLLKLNNGLDLTLTCLFEVIWYVILFDCISHTVLRSYLIWRHLQNNIGQHIHNCYKTSNRNFFNKLSKGLRLFLFHMQVYLSIKILYFQ
jgi:hypothetical protein